MHGQTGIRLREALRDGNVDAALAALPALDDAHRIELLLGAALRDARDGHRAARLYLSAEQTGDWTPVLAALATPPDDRLDRLAAAYIAEGRVPERWRPDGRPLDRALPRPEADVAVAAAYADGIAGLALLDAFADLRLHPAVSRYYRGGTIHALGPRPLLVLAASGDGD